MKRFFAMVMAVVMLVGIASVSFADDDTQMYEKLLLKVVEYTAKE